MADAVVEITEETPAIQTAAPAVPVPPVIEMRNIIKTFGKGDGKVTALAGVSLRIEQGEFVALLGPSGSGKTTLMNIIGLMDTADEGLYLLDGIDISTKKEKNFSKLRNEKIGFVFQKYNLIPKYTALYNVALPALVKGESYRSAKARATDVLTKMGLGDRMKHRPNELSGGQAQRVAIARALAGNGSLILADEPTGALDRKTGVETLQYLQRLNAEGKTILVITHDHAIAEMAKRTVRIEDGKIKS